MFRFAAMYASRVPWWSRWSSSTFVTTATCGLWPSVSSWKLESSRTTTSSGRSRSSSWMTGVPMFPPTMTRRVPRASTRSTSVVVVVFPFVPVIPTIVAGQSRKKRAISVRTGTRRCSARRMVGDRGRIPGMTKTKSGSARARSSLEGPSTSSTSFAVSPRRAIPSARSSSRFGSVIVTRAPLPTR